jgi:hypothetical protein
MPNAAYLRDSAEQCRNLLKRAVDQRAIDQLRQWIADFEIDAARTEKHSRVRSARLGAGNMRLARPLENASGIERSRQGDGRDTA